MDALEVIRARRSIGRLVEPAPSEEDVRTMLEAAACAPDHGELRPFRFCVLSGERLDAFGEVLEAAYRARCAEAGEAPVPAKAEKERTKLRRAPMVIVAAAVRQPTDKIPWVEQQAAVACAAQNVLLAATALGYGSMWRTGDPAYDERVKEALGLGPHDAIAGFLYVGTPTEAARANKPPHEPDLDGLLIDWQP